MPDVADAPPATEAVTETPAAADASPAAAVAACDADSAAPLAAAPAAGDTPPAAAPVTADLPPAAAALGAAKWVYLDDSNTQQGPFSTEEISAWLAAGYLDLDRKFKHIEEENSGDFVALRSIPELSLRQGFQPVPWVGAPVPAPDPSALVGKSTGEVKNWNDEKGFGFIVPDSGGDNLFAHRTDLVCNPGDRPALSRGLKVAYEVGTGSDGRPRAQGLVNTDGSVISPIAAMGSMMPLVSQSTEGKLMGEVKNWNEEKGFGFIVPQTAGDDVFVHRTELVGLSERPALTRGQHVCYELGVGNDGRSRATNVTNADGSPIGDLAAQMGGTCMGVMIGGIRCVWN